MDVKRELIDRLYSSIKLGDDKKVTESLIESNNIIDKFMLLNGMQEAIKRNKWNLFKLFYTAWACQLCDVEEFQYQTARWFLFFYKEANEGDAVELSLKFIYDRLQELRFAEMDSNNLSVEDTPRRLERYLLSITKTRFQIRNFLNVRKTSNDLLILLLDNAVERNNRCCLDILTRSLNIQKIYESFNIILNSFIKDKFDIIKRMINNRRLNNAKDLDLLVYLVNHNVSMENLKNLLSFMDFTGEDKQNLTVKIFSCHEFEFFQYGMKLKLFDFDEDTALCSILLWKCYILNDLLTYYPNVYQSLFEDADLFKFENFEFPKASTMLTIFSHPNFQQKQNYRNTFLKLLCGREVFSKIVNGPFVDENNWLCLFCVTLHCSENSSGLSQDIVNYAFNKLLQSSIKASESGMIICYRLIVTLIWYGYSVDDLKLPEVFYRIIREDNIHNYLFTFLLHAVDQRSFNFMVKKKEKRISVMSLKGMVRSFIRKHIRRPFRKNLDILGEDLPILTKRQLGLDAEIEGIDIQRFKYKVLENELLIDGQDNFFKLCSLQNKHKLLFSKKRKLDWIMI
ncbi:unnamed protein product [Dimorphilus gyrociliatus]|uniref:Uncharacterized protein n=1 Tax=Dimorphilus gyrociliatus TaxID=2664684 RepID=A0A7I8VP47_9ANNE|nr:unnamed protein product [Dimorphilus gyrociliatus]